MTTTDPTKSILDQARAEGREDGYWSGAQLKMCERDQAFYDGQCDAWADAPSRFRWWLFGLACGLLPAFWSIVP